MSHIIYILLLPAYHCAGILETNKKYLVLFQFQLPIFNHQNMSVYVYTLNLCVGKHRHIEMRDRKRRGVEEK